MGHDHVARYRMVHRYPGTGVVMTYRTPIKGRMDVELALDAGQLYTAVTRGNGVHKWWQCRRNGMTKTWKRSPDKFRIPIKFGFRGTGQITDATDTQLYFRIAATREDAERERT